MKLSCVPGAASGDRIGVFISDWLGVLDTDWLGVLWELPVPIPLSESLASPSRPRSVVIAWSSAIWCSEQHNGGKKLKEETAGQKIEPDDWLSAATDGRELRATSGKRSKYRESTVKGRKTRGQRVIVATSGKIYLMVESHSGYEW